MMKGVLMRNMGDLVSVCFSVRCLTVLPIPCNFIRHWTIATRSTQVDPCLMMSSQFILPYWC